MKKGIVALTILGLLGVPGLVSAAEVIEGELYYGAISEVAGDEFLAKYSSPSGDVYYKCSTETLECRKIDDIRLLGDGAYKFGITRSPDGTAAVETYRFPGVPQAFYYSYTIEDGELENKKLMVYTTDTTATHISRDGEWIVFQNTNGSLARAKVGARTAGKTVSLPISPYRLLSISPDGQYAAAYSDSLGRYGFVNLETGQTATYASGYGSVVEFSDTSGYATILTQNASGIHELKLIDLGSFPTLTTVSEKINEGKVVTDYLYAGNELFYMSNDDTPLKWKLVAVDPETREKTTVEENASYGDYIKAIEDDLFYLKQDGKVRNIYRYDTETKTSEKTTGTPVSAAANLSRSEMDIAGVHGALVEPQNAEGDTLPLVIWMHGGPQRQTSLEYHPYLSYGVYDELLEDIAANGARVFKIDYTGSWGYGREFLDALRDNVGVKEMADIRNAITELESDHPTSKTFLIGNSYGGYTALKGAVDFPELIDGTVAIAPVTDWFNLIYEIPGSPFTTQFGGQATDPSTQAKYRAASIIKDLNRIDTDPVVLVYGEVDKTVPPRQSRQFLTVAGALKKDNVTGVELKGEDHVIKYRASLDTLCEATIEAFDLDEGICK